MKLPTTLALPFLIATLTSGTAFPQEPNNRPAPEKACSGERTEDDWCEGKALNKGKYMHSFHNCKNAGGTSCCLTKKKDHGEGGLPVSGAGLREDCGYYYSGKCKNYSKDPEPPFYPSRGCGK